MKIRAIHILFLLAATLLAFASTTQHGFLYWDDQDLVVTNPLLQHLSWHDLQQIWSQPYKGLYTPLAYTIWAILAAISRGVLGGLDPRLFHGLNLLLHCINAILVCAILCRLTKNITASLAAAAIWAVHPLQVEAVAWISGFNNLLAATFGLSSILIYTRAIESPRPRRGFLYALGAFLFLLALFSKPTAVVIPLIIIVIDHFVLRRRWIDVVKTIAPFLLLAIGFALIASHAQPAIDVYVPTWWGRLLVAGDAIGFYLAKIFWPAGLHVDYGRTPQWVLSHWVLGIVILVILVGIWITRLRRSAIGIGLMIFVVALLPVLGLASFDFQKYSTVADRYVYLAMLGIAYAIARLNVRWLALPVILVLVLLSHRQAHYWADDRTLFDHDLALNRLSAAAYSDLAAVDLRDGNISAAQEHLAAALSVVGPDADLEYRWGNLLLNKADNPAAAIEHYRKSLQLREDARTHINLGIALYKVGDHEAAKREFARALELDPNNADAKKNLGILNREK